MIAGVAPERVTKLVLLDEVGAGSSNDPEKLYKRFKQSLSLQYKFKNRKPRIYETKEECVDRMCSMNAFLPRSCAQLLVERGTESVVNFDGEKGVRFLHDPRLPGKLMSTWKLEDTCTFLRKISCPVLLMRATKRNYKVDEEVVKVKVSCLKNVIVEQFSSGHHLHMEFPEQVWKIMEPFLLLESTKNTINNDINNATSKNNFNSPFPSKL